MSEKKLSDKAMQLFASLSVQFTEAITKVIADVDDQAAGEELGIIPLGQAVGGAFASALFEATNDPENPDAPLTEEETQVMLEVGQHMLTAYNRRLLDIRTMYAVTGSNNVELN